MPAPTFDLQSHSVFSDGELDPAGVVNAAAAAGVELLALTDHDSTEGVATAQAAAAAAGIALVTGVEISVLDPAAQDLHLLGYGIDPANVALNAQLAESRGDRERRADRMVARLSELGWQADTGLLASHIAAGKTVGRPHIAQAVVRNPVNAARLAQEGLDDPSAFLVAYLIEGTPGFVSRAAPDIAHAIELIHTAGGVAVWAHPFWDLEAAPEALATLERFTRLGLDGVEAFYATHTRAQTEMLVERARELGLLTTGSADFHGPHHQHFNRFRAFETYGLEPTLGVIASGH